MSTDVYFLPKKQTLAADGSDVWREVGTGTNTFTVAISAGGLDETRIVAVEKGLLVVSIIGVIFGGPAFGHLVIGIDGVTVLDVDGTSYFTACGDLSIGSALVTRAVDAGNVNVYGMVYGGGGGIALALTTQCVALQ